MQTKPPMSLLHRCIILVIVTCILVLFLGDVVSVSLNWLQRRGSPDAARRELDYFRSSFQDYYLDHGSYPDDSVAFAALYEAREAIDRNRIWNGPYASRLPIDPWGTDLRYQHIGQEFIRLSSPGEDRLYGTTDDIGITFGPPPE